MTLTDIRRLTDEFEELDGRRPRVLLVGLDTELAPPLRVYAAAFADAGFDIDVSPAQQSAEDCAKMAVENDVHAVGLCSGGCVAQSGAYFDALRASLEAQDRPDMQVFVRAAAPQKGALASYPTGGEPMEDVAALIQAFHTIFA